jgi:hypothetical protein
MAVHELKRFSFIVDFTEPDPQVDSPDVRARMLAEHDKAIRAAGAHHRTPNQRYSDRYPSENTAYPAPNGTNT